MRRDLETWGTGAGVEKATRFKMRPPSKYFLPLLLLALSPSYALEIEELHVSLGIPVFLISTRGAYLEMLFNETYAVQAQAYQYLEFQGGGFPLKGDTPFHQYDVFGLHVGYYKKARHAKIGVQSGLAFVDGVIRGKYLRTDSTCKTVCTEYRVHEEIPLNDFALPLRFIAGLNWKYIGVTLGPQFYLARGKWFWNVPLYVEIGRL